MGFFVFTLAAAATTAGLLISVAMIAVAVVVTARNARRRIGQPHAAATDH